MTGLYSFGLIYKFYSYYQTTNKNLMSCHVEEESVIGDIDILCKRNLHFYFV